MSNLKYIKYPEKDLWESLIQRPKLKGSNLQSLCKETFDTIREEGDAALYRLTQEYDQVELETLFLTSTELKECAKQTNPALVLAIHQAYANISAFHKAQIPDSITVETMPGVICKQIYRPIERIGIYVPGGTAPLVSTVLMLAIPALLAGCKEIVLCTPPNKSGQIDPAICYAAQLCGVDTVLKLGGIQAIGAMAVGTPSIKPVGKIVGPGNQYVTAAKTYAQEWGVAIDLPAGPSEVLVITNESSNPYYVAADLLSQAEHGIDSQVVLLSTNESIIQKVCQVIDELSSGLNRLDIIKQSLQHARFILLQSIDDCFEFSNQYAPEHLIIAIDKAGDYVSQVVNAGSVFLGHYTPESVGDYASGTNHTLPTAGYAKNYSGVTIDTFIKKITVQEVSQKGLQLLTPTIEQLAGAEGLEAHALAATIRNLQKKEIR